MHTCGFCKDPVPAFDKPRRAHIVIGQTEDGHIHTHGDIDDKFAAQELLDAASENIGLTARISANGQVPKEIVFHNRQRIGDILMFTCGVRDFKKAFPETRVNVISTACHIWDHNPAIDRTLKNTDQNTIKIGPGKGTNQSNRIDWHFANAYRISIEDALKVHIPQGTSRPDIWFTEEEYEAPRIFKDPYWLIVVNGEKGWNAKMYPFERWQEVIHQNPDITFVQIGTQGDDPPRLQGKNVIDHVGKTEDKNTGIRDLFKLFLNAEGSMGLVSFHMHLSGALWKPAVVIAGAREPSSFTKYEGHQYLETGGTLPCAVQACWACDLNPPEPQKSRCTNQLMISGQRVPKCVDMIEPSDVTAAIRRYYTGGRLIKGMASEKTPRKLCNIVPTPAQVPVSETKRKDREFTNYGLEWGQGAIDPKDWPFIKEVIEKNRVKTVLEFGAGLSTILMSEIASVSSFETEQEWIEKVIKISSKPKVYGWNGRDMQTVLAQEYDLAFVDGPANGQNREEAVRLAVNHSKMVILHDATREWESKWEAKYLKPGFQGPIKGGKWCHLWIKTPSFTAYPRHDLPKVREDAKRIKIVSTARGWGGCARSVTTIMKMLLKEGHSVEFIPFRNKVSSNEFKDALKNGLMDVKVSESYEAVREPCDTLLVYADDFVWDFDKPEISDIFKDIKASRKIMMVNYRRGGIGEIEWTKGWDKYLFLNSGQQKDFLKKQPESNTGVLPPCTDLTPFFEMSPKYELPLRIVRHNSQGDTKFSKNAGEEIINALEAREDAQIHMMPGPSFVSENPPRFVKHSRNNPPVHKFLEMGNLFWYSLPKGYMDMGPRVILEAMAAGLPVLADPWGGAVDRVTSETGWLCSKEEQIEIISTVTEEELKQKGEAARERAFEEFRPEKWIEELTGELCHA